MLMWISSLTLIMPASVGLYMHTEGKTQEKSWETRLYGVITMSAKATKILFHPRTTIPGYVILLFLPVE